MQIIAITPEQTLPLRQQVLWPDQPIDFCRVPEDEQGYHFGIIEGDQLLCTASIFIDGRQARLRKFATSANHQGQGIGSRMLNYLLEWLPGEGVTQLWLDARLTACEFYRRFGFEREPCKGSDYRQTNE